MVGPRGGVTITIVRWRVSGQPKTWVTRPEDFRVPIKYGMRDYGYLDPSTAEHLHVAGTCPLDGR